LTFTPQIAIGGIAALLATAALTRVVLSLAHSRRVLIDAPNERSSHVQPKPRGGGIGVVGGLGVGLAILYVGTTPSSDVLALLLGTFVCAMLGLWDDLRGLAVVPRLAVETAIASWLVYETGPLLRLPLPAPLDLSLGLLGYTFPVIWIVGVMNFFNFMDGIDGLATGQAMASLLAVVLFCRSPDASAVAFLTLCALAGFLPFNWWPSRIFLGDVGSLPVGFLLASLPLLEPAPGRSEAMLAAAAGLTLFLLDPVLTLWRRFRRGARLGDAHREHLYQILVSPKDAHRGVALGLIAAGLVLSLLGGLSTRVPNLAWPMVLIAALAFLAEYLASRRVRS
jgi:UDP-N-acetylmuramyl pentapeptide phosphotransferase/UDP-N-acetylglucosamine-1-phosphate transferase